MPEANVLYSVTAAVIVGLVAWVMVVLKTAKEPWARPSASPLRVEQVPHEGASVAGAKLDEDKADAQAKVDAEVDKAADQVEPDTKLDDAK